TMENGGDCITCEQAGQSNKNFYLDTDKIRNLSGVKVASTSKPSSGALGFRGIEIGEKYAVFLTYEPDGAVRSECAVGEATVNYSVSENNFEGKATQKQPQCFIATAAYGTPM